MEVPAKAPADKVVLRRLWLLAILLVGLILFSMALIVYYMYDALARSYRLVAMSDRIFDASEWDYDENGNRLFPLDFHTIPGEPLRDGFGSIRFGRYVYRPLTVAKERIIQKSDDNDTIILWDPRPTYNGRYLIITANGACYSASEEELKSGKRQGK